MSKICYVIATWDGMNWHNSKGKVKRIHTRNSGDVLQTHLDKLNSLQHNLDMVVIVKPINKNPEMAYPNYYDIEKQLKNLKCKHEIITCENYGFSYAQWLRVYKKYTDSFDYYIFVEDDTCAGVDNFDTKLLDTYKLKFLDNIGYLCGFVGIYHRNLKKNNQIRNYKNPIFGTLHAAISYGIVSSHTLQKVFLHWTDPIEIIPSLYATKILKISDFKIFCGGDCQLGFSLLFTLANIPLKDYKKEYACVFWICSTEEEDHFREYSFNNEMIIMPTQMINSPKIVIHKYQGKIKNIRDVTHSDKIVLKKLIKL